MASNEDFGRKLKRAGRRTGRWFSKTWKNIKRAWYDLDKKKAAIIACCILVALLIVAVVFAVAGKKKSAQEPVKEPDQETAVSELPQETPEAHEVIALTPDGAMFPSLDVEIPTTEPAPEIIYPGMESWLVADIQQRLMDLGFMDSDEPTTYYGDGTSSSVKLFQRYI